MHPPQPRLLRDSATPAQYRLAPDQAPAAGVDCPMKERPSFLIQLCDRGSAFSARRASQGSGAIGIGVFGLRLTREENLYFGQESSQVGKRIELDLVHRWPSF